MLLLSAFISYTILKGKCINQVLETRYYQLMQNMRAPNGTNWLFISLYFSFVVCAKLLIEIEHKINLKSN